MPWITPSEVVRIIDKAFPGIATDPKGVQNMDRTYLLSVSSIIDLVEQIPAELLMPPADKYLGFVVGLAALRSAQAIWESGGGSHPTIVVPYIRGFDPHPIRLIRDALTACPDEAPASGTTELSFIVDADLRESIRNDISEANAGLSEGRWKAAT